MSTFSKDEILAEIGAEPLDGSGFESEEPEVQDEGANDNSEVAE